eukprot:c8960_g1_i3.p1 GENE.c8960_g1_i3~~c8960_g1_i3.p1  ORF type:complete len:160 (+),score=42.19 c8960_g1_i3:106-585(+)
MESPTGIRRHSSDKKVKWNEANLEANDLAKTPRMKIDEPPTPYLPPRSWDDDDDHHHHHQAANPTGSPELTQLPPSAQALSGELTAEALERNMAFVTAAASEKRSRMPRRSNSHDSDGSGPISPTNANATDFALRRKIHYDEGFKLKQALAKGIADSDD